MLYTEEKFQRIYDKYKNRVLKVVFDMTKDYHLSQDICQETFMKLYGYQDHVDEEKVKSWLLVVAGNQVRDYFKKRRKVHRSAGRRGYSSPDPGRRPYRGPGSRRCGGEAPQAPGGR